MEVDISRQYNPEEQLRIISKMEDISKAKLDQLEQTIQNFSTKFGEQEDGLTKLYQKTKEQQGMYNNIITVRNHLNEILEKLDSNQRLMPILKTNPQSNFDQFMAAMSETIQAKNYLDRFQFDDAFVEKSKLSHLTTRTAETVLSYFKELAIRSTIPVSIENFSFKNGKFVNAVPEYENDILYLVPSDILHRMRTMADVLTQIGLKSHISIYCDSHSSVIMKCFEEILDKAKKRTTLPGPLNILDLPTYRSRSHPFHLFAHVLSFFFMREKAFARAVFGDQFRTPFDGSMKQIFDVFVKTVESLFINIQAHTDVLFDLDVVDTLSQITEQFINTKDLDSYTANISRLSHSFHTTIVRILEQFKKAVEVHDLNAVPNSGGVTAVTSNVIIFLCALTEYPVGIQQSGGLSLNPYVTSVLNCLQKNNIEKSNHYTDVVLKQLFLMNNAHYAYTAIQAHPVLSQIVSSEFTKNVEDVIQNAQKEYMNETWNKAFAILNYDIAFDGVKKGQKLTDLQKTIIKNKFKDFKNAVLQIQNKHNAYCLKNEKLMAPIKNEANSKSSKFEAFYMRFHDSGFASHPEKYTVVQPSTLEQFIDRLYSPKKTSKPK